MRSRIRRGNTTLEFALVAVPFMFVVISGVEMARGMWLYHSLANAVRVTARYATVHGAGCSSGTNTCSINVGDLATLFEQTAPGLPTGSTNLKLTATNGTTSCSPVSSCTSSSVTWPPAGANGSGSAITVVAWFTFHSALAMGDPTATFSNPVFVASSKQVIQF